MSKDGISFRLLADMPEAIPTVATWYFGAWGHTQKGNSIEATIERIKGKLNRDRAPLHVVASKNDQLLGVAQHKLHEMSEYPDMEYWLGSLFVTPEARGQGISQALSMEVCAVATSFGIKQLYLCTEYLNGGLYCRAGWNALEQTHSRGDKVLVMVKKLEG